MGVDPVQSVTIGAIGSEPIRFSPPHVVLFLSRNPQRDSRECLSRDRALIEGVECGENGLGVTVAQVVSDRCHDHREFTHFRILSKVFV